VNDLNEAYDLLATESISGNLGLFIGSGFSKSIYNQAKSWKDLVKEIAQELGVEISPTEGESYPEYLSKIIDEFAKSNNHTLDKVSKRVKHFICQKSFWMPRENEEYNNYRELLIKLNPKWVVLNK